MEHNAWIREIINKNVILIILIIVILIVVGLLC